MDLSSHPVVVWIMRYGFSLMLILLIGSLVSDAATPEELPLLRPVLALALVAGVLASEVKPRWSWCAVALAASVIAIDSAGLRQGKGFAETWLSLPLIVLILFTLAVSFVHVMKTENIDLNKLAGSFCVYFMLAVFWGLLYGLLYEEIGPAAFKGLPEGISLELAERELHYFSWVTLTTVGYGDLSPVHPLARLLCNLECFVGQFYIAVVVARMVAIQVTMSMMGGTKQ